MGTASFVVATYGRPDALVTALHSAQHQTGGAWEAVVVGDACDDHTAEAVAGLDDPRIRYYNLPSRFGEQGGPNTAGLSVARGDRVCFLNHDDVLLPDFLERAGASMTARRRTFHLARFALVEDVRSLPDGRVAPRFTDLSPVPRSPRVLMEHSWTVFEPASAWLVDMDLARRTGRWRHSSRLGCWPLRDWALRAAQHGARFDFGTEVTGIRFWSHNRHRTVLYGAQSPEHVTMDDWLARMSAEELRALVAADLPDVARPEVPLRRRLAHEVALEIAWRRYRLTGIDPVTSGRTRQQQRREARQLLVRRTGDASTDRTGLRRFLEDPEAFRVL